MSDEVRIGPLTRAQRPVSNEVRIGPVTRAQVVSDFYCVVTIKVDVKCTAPGCFTSYSMLSHPARFGDMIEWLELPPRWNVVNREPYCPLHAISIDPRGE